MLVGRLVVADVLVHRRQAAQGLRGVRLRAGLDGERERRRQMIDRLLGMPEQELKAAEVEHQAAGVSLVVQLLVDRLRLLCVLAGEHPVAHLLGDERGLEVRSGDDPRVVHRLRELDRALDVLARGLVVGLSATTTRAPREDPRAQQVARQLGPLGELERLVEQRDRGGMLEIRYRQQPSRKSTSARSTSANAGELR